MHSILHDQGNMTMSTAANKVVIRRGFEEGINQRNTQVYDEVIASG